MANYRQDVDCISGNFYVENILIPRQFNMRAEGWGRGRGRWGVGGDYHLEYIGMASRS